MLLVIMLALHVNNALRHALKDAVLPALNKVVAAVRQTIARHATLGHKLDNQLSASLKLSVDMNHLIEVVRPTSPSPRLVAAFGTATLPPPGIESMIRGLKGIRRS